MDKSPPNIEEDVICTCTGTTKTKINKLIENGADDIDKISSSTGAATGCGACDILIMALLEKQKKYVS